MDQQVRRPPAPSGHPVIGHALEFARGPFEFVDRATTECGDVYRMSLPRVDVYVLANPAYFRQVLVTDVDAFVKTTDFRRVFGNGLLSTEGEQWSRQRRTLQPLFRRDRLERYAEPMLAATRRRLETWEPGEVKDIEAEMQDLTIEILFATLFGRVLRPGEGDELRTASDGLNKWFAPTSWLLPNWVPTPSRREFAASVERLRTEVRHLLAASDARADDESRETLLSNLHAASERGDLTPSEVEDQLLTMIFAGYETTAAALGFAWYSLARTPDVREAFHDELDAVCGDDPLTHDAVSSLAFTDRVVTETLRTYPPVHTIPRKTTRAVEVGGYRIPAGEQVHLSVLSVHRDERFYDDPMAFRPDRWTPAFEASLPDLAFAPFGGGRRTCIGRDFARLEATLVLAAIGRRFTLEWVGDDAVGIEPEITTQAKGGLPMRIRRR